MQFEEPPAAGFPVKKLTEYEPVKLLIHQEQGATYLLGLPDGSATDEEDARRYWGDDGYRDKFDLGPFIQDLEEILDTRKATNGFGDTPIGELQVDAETHKPLRIDFRREHFFTVGTDTDTIRAMFKEWVDHWEVNDE